MDYKIFDRCTGAIWIMNNSIVCMQVKVKKQYPLKSIVNIVYNETDSPVEFKLEFQKMEVTLEAYDESSCQQWVDTIRKGM